MDLLVFVLFSSHLENQTWDIVTSAQRSVISGMVLRAANFPEQHGGLGKPTLTHSLVHGCRERTQDTQKQGPPSLLQQGHRGSQSHKAPALPSFSSKCFSQGAVCLLQELDPQLPSTDLRKSLCGTTPRSTPPSACFLPWSRGLRPGGEQHSTLSTWHHVPQG
jgi:hypothetical protein